MGRHTEQDEKNLYQMYIHSGIRAIEEAPEAEGITILRTSKGKEYCFPFSFQSDFVPNILSTLTAGEDVCVLYLLHVWKNHALDVPSYGLRQALTALHPENQKALLMLIGEENFVIRSIQETMPNKKEGQ